MLHTEVKSLLAEFLNIQVCLYPSFTGVLALGHWFRGGFRVFPLSFQNCCSGRHTHKHCYLVCFFSHCFPTTTSCDNFPSLNSFFSLLCFKQIFCEKALCAGFFCSHFSHLEYCFSSLFWQIEQSDKIAM